MANRKDMEAAARERRETQIQETKDAREAEFLLSHPMVTNALAAIQNHYVMELLNTKELDEEGRENAYRMVRIAGKFKLALTGFIETGSLASFAEAEESARAERTDD